MHRCPERPYCLCPAPSDFLEPVVTPVPQPPCLWSPRLLVELSGHMGSGSAGLPMEISLKCVPTLPPRTPKGPHSTAADSGNYAPLSLQPDTWSAGSARPQGLGLSPLPRAPSRQVSSHPCRPPGAFPAARLSPSPGPSSPPATSK